MKNTMNTKQKMIETFKELYKSNYDAFKKAIRNDWKETRNEALEDMESISELYVKVVYGITYLSIESNICKKVSVHDFVEVESKFRNQCEKEYYIEKRAKESEGK